MAIFVLTSPEDGWDCIRGVYDAKTELDVMKHYIEEYGETTDDPETWFEDANLILHQEKVTKVN